MSKKNIRISRYQDPSCGWEASITPEDDSWVVFVPNEGDALFYRRVEAITEEGVIEQAYADVELPCSMPMQHLQTLETPPPFVQKKPEFPGPIDYTVTPCEWAEGGEGSPEAPGFWAHLNVRAVSCWGLTEHDAIQALMNYVAQLCTAGCLDHTGARLDQPGDVPRLVKPNPRRYAAVFGSE